ncbi:MAG: aspartate aminotransferase family protein [Trueperaceae bacterium]|nr:MAG: aspartate aminotransferase family protein [Trueperaceae bacterium]
MDVARLAPVWSHLAELRPVRGEGVYLFDESGERWTDFTSGIGVVNTGHAHPHVVAALRAQAERLLFAQVGVAPSPLVFELAERLGRISPEGIDTFFFTNSGAEATEAAVKLARHATGRPNVVVFQGSFHGRTHLTMAMTTSKTVYRQRYPGLAGAIAVAPFPYAYRYGWSEDEAVAFALRELDQLLAGQSAPDETAAFVIEPVLGEGGYVPAPTAFLAGLRERADRHGILLVIDEVQTGFGRTGTLWNVTQHGVRPDVTIMAKGLGSGLPISGIGARADLMARWERGTHGGTYGGGSLLPIAAAHATLDVMEREALPANATARGEHLRSGLCALQARHPAIGDVRGPGLMVGVEFGAAGGGPDGATAKAVQRACLDERLLLLTCGTFDQVIRWIPPLVVSDAQIDAALATFARALERHAASERAGAGA